MKKKQIQREKFIATAKPSLGTYATRSRHLSGGREPGATEQPDSGRMIHLGKQEQAPPAPQQPGLQVTLPHGTERPGAALGPGGIWGVSVAGIRTGNFGGFCPQSRQRVGGSDPCGWGGSGLVLPGRMGPPGAGVLPKTLSPLNGLGAPSGSPGWW